jgi:hypothetical protein
MESYVTSKGFKVQKFDDTLSVVDQLSKRNFYRFLTYDKTRGMNIGCSDESEIDSLFKALKYYQDRTKTLETELKTLSEKVNTFINSLGYQENE